MYSDKANGRTDVKREISTLYFRYEEYIGHILLFAFVILLSFSFLLCNSADAFFGSTNYEQMPNQMVERKVITPQMFGAVGNGTADDTQSFLSMATYCNENPGTYVEIPTGHYMIFKPLVFTESVTIQGVGQDTILDFSRITDSDGSAILITGGYQKLGTLKSPQNAGQNTLVFQKQAGLSAGDIVAVIDPTDYSWSLAKAYYRKGEYCKISSSTASGADLVNFLNDDYDAGCHLFLMNMVTCNISGVQISVYDRGNVFGMIPLTLCYVKDTVIRDITARGSNKAQIMLQSCYNVLLDRIQADYICEENMGENYGLGISNSQFIQVKNSVLSALRHGMAIGGSGNAVPVINRYITVSDSIITGQVITGADIHSNSQFINYDRCRIFNGIDFGGSDIIVNNCDIYTDKRPLWIASYRLINGNVNLTNNRCYTLNNQARYSPDYLTFISLPSDERVIASGTILIENNVFEGSGDCAIRISATNCANRCILIMRNNTVDGGILIENFFNVVIDGNFLNSTCHIKDSDNPAYSSSEVICFTNNYQHEAKGDGIWIDAPFDNLALVNVSRNTFSNVNGIAVNIENNENLPVVVSDNVYASCTINSNLKR